MHKHAVGHTREEIVTQVKEEENKELLYDFASYVPVGNSVQKIKTWKEQNAEILYLTSRTKAEEIADVRGVLTAHKFSEGELLFRKEGEEYKDVAERVVPDILIEDDCESIGGMDELTITHVKPEIKEKIKSIIVKEFGGIDHLSDMVSELLV